MGINTQQSLLLLTILLTELVLTQSYRPHPFIKIRHPSRTAAMMASETTTKIQWIVRPATLSDADSITLLLKESYGTLLRLDYSESCLANCLPLITVAQPQLLTCGTWYVVVHPETEQMVGCGGWTARAPGSSAEADRAVVPHLRHFAVHPSFVRKGVASLLWQQSLASIRDTVGGIPALEVFSTITAEPFYMQCGFHTIRHMEIELKKDLFFPCILMRRKKEESKEIMK